MDVRTRVGTLHKVQEQLGWGPSTTLKALIELDVIQEPGGWLVCWSKWILDPTLAFIRAQLGAQYGSISYCIHFVEF